MKICFTFPSQEVNNVNWRVLRYNLEWEALNKKKKKQALGKADDIHIKSPWK